MPAHGHQGDAASQEPAEQHVAGGQAQHAAGHGHGAGHQQRPPKEGDGRRHEVHEEHRHAAVGIEEDRPGALDDGQRKPAVKDLVVLGAGGELVQGVEPQGQGREQHGGQTQDLAAAEPSSGPILAVRL